MPKAPKKHNPNPDYDAKKYHDRNRQSASERGYDWQWHKIRLNKISHNPLCERCEKINRIMRAIIVHHKDRNPKNNHPDNLEALCVECHDKEHEKERFKQKEY